MDNTRRFGRLVEGSNPSRGTMNTMKETFSIILLFLLFFSLIPNLVGGAGLVPCGGGGEDPCQLHHLFQMIVNVINFIIFTIVPPIAVLMLIIGGIVYLFAFGSPETANKGKQIIVTTIIGVALVYGSWLIINTIVSALGYTYDWTHPF